MSWLKPPHLRPVSRSDAAAAAEILGIKGTPIDVLDALDVRIFARTMLKRHHPDAQLEDPTDSALKIKAILDARATLLRWVAERPDSSCTVCRGKGYTRILGGLGSVPCPRCSEV